MGFGWVVLVAVQSKEFSPNHPSLHLSLRCAMEVGGLWRHTPPPEAKPGQTSGLEGHIPNEDQKRRKPNDAIGRKQQLIWRQQLLRSPYGKFPPTATSTSGFTQDFLFGWLEPICLLLFFLSPCITSLVTSYYSACDVTLRQLTPYHLEDKTCAPSPFPKGHHRMDGCG